jgi:type I restriction enzyme S subunit
MSEWSTVTIGDQISIIPGFPFDSKYFTSEGGMPLVRIRDLMTGSTDTNYRGPYDKSSVINNGDVLVGMDGDFNIARWKGRTALLNQRMLKLAGRNGSSLHLPFLFYVLGPFLKHINDITAATTVKHLSTYDISKARISVPPLSKQQKIARILTTVDNLIEQTEVLIEKYKSIKQGMMHDLFTRGVDQSGRLRPPCEEAPHLYKESPLGWIPREWEAETLGRACCLLRDGTHLPPARVGTGPLLLSVQNMIGGKFELTDRDTRIPWNFYNTMHKSWKPETGDVLLAVVGATIGKVCRVPSDFPTFTLQRSVAIFRGIDELLLTEFMYFYMLTDSFQTAIWNRANQTAQPGVYLGELSKVLIPLPPFLEQKKIHDLLESVNNLIDEEADHKSKLILQKSGLMQDLLTGKVRVNVDETEESNHPTESVSCGVGL